MYLMEIAEVDDRWPDFDDGKAISFFHRKRALKALRAFINKIGRGEYEKLREVFP